MNVKTVADQLCDSEAGFASPSQPVQPLIEYGRLPEFVALTKPRVMMLAVFTALVGLISAPVRLELFVAFTAVLAIAAGAGSAGVLNMWYDADIDAVMTRTAMRPIPRGKVSRSEALVFGLVLAVAAVAGLALATNITAAALLAGAILFYVVVYTALAEAVHAPEHRDRWRGRCAAARHRMGRRDRGHWSSTACLVPYHLSMDAASLLGTGAQSARRIRPCGRADAAGRCGTSCDNAADLGL